MEIDDLIAREWLTPFGNGGYAASTTSGINSRAYHGLLVAAIAPPLDRRVVVSHVDEILALPGGDVELATHHYEPDVVHPRGHELVVEFTPGPPPSWRFRTGEVELRKTIRAARGRNACLVEYELLHGDRAALTVRPFLTWRSFHGGREAVVGDVALTDTGATWTPRGAEAPLNILTEGEVVPDPVVHRRFRREAEARRGLAHTEDLESPLRIRVQLDREAPRTTIGFVLDGPVVDAPGPTRPSTARSPFDRLREAAAACLIRDPVSARPGVLAGYHWFNEWGRDTMIALPGLAAALGSWDLPLEILDAWSARLSRGMLPNRLAEPGEEDLYNSADAALWFLLAVERAAAVVGSHVADRHLEALIDVTRFYVEGTRHGIGVDAEDGLLRAGTGATQLTWMDAKVGDWVVTPRAGSCVELNALLHSGLGFTAECARRCGRSKEAAFADAAADRMASSFVRAFWSDSRGCLRDLADEPEDAGIRPNQVIALALPRCPLDPALARRALDTVDAGLLTPFGLRTLSPNAPDYRGTYGGDPLSRDGAYHQGTVWPWLLGPWTDATLRLRGDAGRAGVAEVLSSVLADLDEYGLGHLSEVFDGDPPHAPGGAVAQAWSACEVYRAAMAAGMIA